jgi:hypothetical protein
MVNFIKQNGEIFSIARDAESAFYMWKISRELNHTIEIDGVNYGNNWQARVEIEKLFGVLYSLNC